MLYLLEFGKTYVTSTEPQKNDTIFIAGCLLVQQWNSVATAAVRDGDVASSCQRVCQPVREQRAAAVHHREVGDTETAAASPHMVML